MQQPLPAQALDGALVADLYDTHVANTYDLDAFGLLAGGRAVAARQLHEALSNASSFPAEARIVDLALGTGASLADLRPALPQAEFVGIDISPKMLDIAAQKHPFIRTILDDAANVARHFAPGSVDLALMHFLTTYINTADVVASLARCLKPGAYLSIASTTYESFRMIHAAASTILPPDLIRALNPAPVDGNSIAALLEGAGLEVVANERFEKEIGFAALPDLLQWG
ncbi:MAG: methyltransferase domain-containing protein, partial [Pseudomonadota bacterium]|nr:methyltransferase domain-containing protein [Pseudomonadota bacterium]